MTGLGRASLEQRYGVFKQAVCGLAYVHLAKGALLFRVILFIKSR